MKEVESLSQEQLLSDRRYAEKARKYHVSLYYHLENQRTLHADQLAAAIDRAESISLNVDGWSRIVDYKYSLHPISCAVRILANVNTGSG